MLMDFFFYYYFIALLFIQIFVRLVLDTKFDTYTSCKIVKHFQGVGAFCEGRILILIYYEFQQNFCYSGVEFSKLCFVVVVVVFNKAAKGKALCSWCSLTGNRN